MDTQLASLAAEIGRITNTSSMQESPRLLRPPGPSWQRILVATDGGPTSSFAVQWAGEIAKLRRAQVTTVHVIPRPPAITYHRRPGAWYATLEDEGRKILTKAERLLRRSRIPHQALLRVGTPAVEIARAARIHRADLVVTGSHGPNLVRRLLLGSVADRVKDSVAADVLVARTPPPALRIMAAIDGSNLGLEAAIIAAWFRGQWDTALTLAHSYFPARFRDRDISDARWLEHAGRLDHAVLGHPGARFEIRWGRPGPQVLGSTRQAGVDLVVVGSRGVGPVRSRLLGSTSSYLTRRAPSSVLVVKNMAWGRERPRGPAGRATSRRPPAPGDRRVVLVHR